MANEDSHNGETGDEALLLKTILLVVMFAVTIICGIVPMRVSFY